MGQHASLAGRSCLRISTTPTACWLAVWCQTYGWRTHFQLQVRMLLLLAVAPTVRYPLHALFAHPYGFLCSGCDVAVTLLVGQIGCYIR